MQSPYGVIELEAEDADELPLTFVATTEKVYAVPALNPVKVHDVLLVFTQFAGGVTKGEEVTV
jgi:hypothetical protein